MFRFQPGAAFDATIYPEPPVEDRTGPPLNRGFVFTLMSTVAGDAYPKEALAVFAKADPNGWYHGQNFETILDVLEAKDPNLPYALGRNIYFMYRRDLDALGIKSAAELIENIPQLWRVATRGDAGAWRVTMTGPRRARLEADQPYNCRFEEGAIVGFLESFNVTSVDIRHVECRRSGAPFCVFEVAWDEGDEE